MKRKNNAPKYDEYDDTKPALAVLNLFDAPRRWMRNMYHWVVGWSEKPSAEKALGALSFAESSFFPIPPDPLLIAMVTAQPKKWLRFATITTACSVLGGLLGYIIGAVAITAVMPIIVGAGYEEAYHAAVRWFADYGPIAVIVAGFTPIPYKIFTIAGGAAHMFILPFLFGSIVGRGGRFFLVAFLMNQFGRRYKNQIEKYIDLLGFAFIALLALGFVVVKYLL